VIRTLSKEAWALLGILHRASHGGPPAPIGLSKAYEELKARDLVRQVTPSSIAITAAGEAALRERYLNRS
jgi:hypothetical protein